MMSRRRTSVHEILHRLRIVVARLRIVEPDDDAVPLTAAEREVDAESRPHSVPGTQADAD
jgi:hypothetical protein